MELEADDVSVCRDENVDADLHTAEHCEDPSERVCERVLCCFDADGLDEDVSSGCPVSHMGVESDEDGNEALIMLEDVPHDRHESGGCRSGEMVSS